MHFYEYKADVIQHELGHWLAARSLGFKTGDIEIRILKGATEFGHEGVATIFPHADFDHIGDIEKYVEHRICILYAGTLAQLINKENVDSATVDGILATDGKDDQSKIKELLHIARGIQFSGKISFEEEIEQSRQIMGKCWEKTASLMTENQSLFYFLRDKISATLLQPNKKYIFTQAQLDGWADDHRSLNCAP